VVFLLLDWHEWWVEQFWGVLKTLSKYPPILLGGPGEETDRDREHARVKGVFGARKPKTGAETGVSERVKGAEDGGSGEVKGAKQEDPRAVFEKPEDLLALMTRRRKMMGLGGSEEGSGYGLMSGIEGRKRAGVEEGSGETTDFARKLLQFWKTQKERAVVDGNGNGNEPRQGSTANGNVTRGSWEMQPIPGAREKRAEIEGEVWPEVVFEADRNIFCFSEVVVGLTTHGNLRIDPSLPPFLDGAQFNDRWKALVHPAYGYSEEDGNLLKVVKGGRLSPEPRVFRNRPKLGLALRSSSPERRIINEDAFVFYAEALGFDVVVLPEFCSMEEHFEWMQELDVLVGVHNSLLANFLFMRKGSVLVQIVPFSTDWHADHHYGQGARAKGLKYIEYQGSWWESSLSMVYEFEDDVRKDADAVYQKYGYLKWRDIYMGQSIWMEDSKTILALRCAKKYLLRRAMGASLEDHPVPEFIQGDFYFEW
jgi:hypothetical protein